MEPIQIGQLILKLIVILAAARFASILANKLKFPAVIGEILVGILLGPSLYNFIIPIKEPVLMFLAEIGIILLLFEVGLKSDINALLKTGRASTFVAIIGIILPFTLVYIYSLAIGISNTGSILMGAILSATGIGITMAVFYEQGKIRSKESEIILGAAVMDDVVGLIILSIIVSLVEQGTIPIVGIAKLILYSLLFFICAIVIGTHLIPPLYKIVAALKISRTFVIGEFILALSLALIAKSIGLATILGAFTAGLILEKTKYHQKIEHRIHPTSQIFVPIFFVMIGANLYIWSIFNQQTLSLIFFLLIIAIIGKVSAGIGAIGAKANKLAIGIGMIPRGGVALILAAFGLSTGLITNSIYSAVVVVIMITAMLVPPILKQLI